MLLQKLLDVVQCVAPGVALVVDEALQEREGRHRAVSGDVIDRACHWNDVREAHRLREKTADLQLRIDAGMKAPVGLEQQPFAEDEHGVAALRAGGTHLSLPCGVAAGKLGEGASAREAYGSMGAADVLTGADGVGNRATKVLVGEGIREH